MCFEEAMGMGSEGHVMQNIIPFYFKSSYIVTGIFTEGQIQRRPRSRKGEKSKATRARMYTILITLQTVLQTETQ